MNCQWKLIPERLHLIELRYQMIKVSVKGKPIAGVYGRTYSLGLMQRFLNETFLPAALPAPDELPCRHFGQHPF